MCGFGVTRLCEGYAQQMRMVLGFFMLSLPFCWWFYLSSFTLYKGIPERVLQEIRFSDSVTRVGDSSRRPVPKKLRYRSNLPPTVSLRSNQSMKPTAVHSLHAYEVRPRKDHHGVDLISDALPFGRLWYDTPDNAIGYAQHYSRSEDAVIRVFDDAGNVIETHEHMGDFNEW